MKRYLFFIIFWISSVYSLSLNISNPSFAPKNEFNFINNNQEAALNDKRGFYYNLSAQYIPPYLINLETDEYYMVDEEKKNKFSLNKLCKEGMINLDDESFLITLKINDEKKEYPIFAITSNEGKCFFNKDIVYIETKSYKQPIKIEVNVKKSNKPLSSFYRGGDLNLFEKNDMKKIQTISFTFDLDSVRTNTSYIPLSISDDNTTINVGFISLILHPVASKLSKSDFTSYGYPNLGDIDIDSIKPLSHPFNPKRNLRRDVALLRKAAFRQDLNMIDECDYFMSYLDEYDLNDYDKNMLLWVIFKDVPNFMNSLCFKEHEKYLVYTKVVPQPKDFVIPALKPEIPAKEIKNIVSLGSYNKVYEKIPFEANRSIKDFKQNMKESPLPNVPLISNEENGTSKLILAKETHEVKSDNLTEENLSEKSQSSEKEIVQNKEKTAKVQKEELKREFDYKKIPFSNISKKERIKLLKELSALFKAKNKKFLSKRIFPLNDIYFTLLSDIPALKIEGLRVKETFVLDRNSLAEILSPLERSRFGCWFLLRSIKVKNSKATSLGEELNRDDYEMVALYKDKNKEIGDRGYLLVYLNFKKFGRRFLINSIAFDTPDSSFFDIIKDRTSKNSRCYQFIKKFKKEIESL